MILPFISQLHPDDLRHLQGRVSPTTWRLFDACTVASLCLKLCVWSSSYAPRQPPLYIYNYIYTCCFKLLLNRCHKMEGLTAVAQWLYSHQYLRESTSQQAAPPIVIEEHPPSKAIHHNSSHEPYVYIYIHTSSHTSSQFIWPWPHHYISLPKIQATQSIWMVISAAKEITWPKAWPP